MLFVIASDFLIYINMMAYYCQRYTKETFSLLKRVKRFLSYTQFILCHTLDAGNLRLYLVFVMLKCYNIDARIDIGGVWFPSNKLFPLIGMSICKKFYTHIQHNVYYVVDIQRRNSNE